MSPWDLLCIFMGDLSCSGNVQSAAITESKSFAVVRFVIYTYYSRVRMMSRVFVLAAWQLRTSPTSIVPIFCGHCKGERQSVLNATWCITWVTHTYQSLAHR